MHGIAELPDTTLLILISTVWLVFVLIYGLWNGLSESESFYPFFRKASKSLLGFAIIAFHAICLAMFLRVSGFGFEIVSKRMLPADTSLFFRVLVGASSYIGGIWLGLRAGDLIAWKVGNYIRSSDGKPPKPLKLFGRKRVAKQPKQRKSP